jgi:arsenite methyltransferase
LIGAAERAPAGRAVGTDIWRGADLSGNTKERVLRNAALAGVDGRVEVRDDDARALSFPDASFDVVVSLLCLHNIAERREQALAEMARVLKPGGALIVSDLDGTDVYARFFERLGFDVDRGPMEWRTFPFQRVVIARKPR